MNRSCIYSMRVYSRTCIHTLHAHFEKVNLFALTRLNILPLSPVFIKVRAKRIENSTLFCASITYTFKVSKHERMFFSRNLIYCMNNLNVKFSIVQHKLFINFGTYSILFKVRCVRRQAQTIWHLDDF